MRKNYKCIAFDCFGTLFDMSGVSKDEISAYVKHVNAKDFSPFDFPQSWYQLKLHEDVDPGISLLQQARYKCIAMSNGTVDLISTVAKNGGVLFDDIIDFCEHKVYKPYIEAYKCIEKQTGFKPSQTLMVTANPTFGDIEGAAAIGMDSIVIRHGHPNDVVSLYWHLY